MHDAPSIPPAAPAANETRISTLVGDRLCIACGYNLVGQPILREPYYNMLIVRCPECATVASVQEYPLLGRWANRWAAMLAALWLGLSIVLWLGTSSAIFGMGVGAAEIAADSYGDLIYEKYSAWQTQQAASSAMGAIAGNPTGAPVSINGQVIITGPSGPGRRVIVNNTSVGFASWWQQQDSTALLADAGGWVGGLSIYVWYLWMWLGIVAVIFGVMWATMMLSRGRAALLLWSFIIILTAAALGLIPAIEWLSQSPGWTHQAALQQIGPVVLGLSMLWAWFWLAFGLMLGRPIARRLVLLLLPPRMRSTMAFLWLSDGKQPPRSETAKR